MSARRLARPVLGLAVAGALAAISFFALRGYFTPETMVYFLTLRWCS